MKVVFCEKHRQISWLKPLLGELIFGAGNSLGYSAQPKITLGADFCLVTQNSKKTCPQGLLFIKTIYCQFIKSTFKQNWHFKILQDFKKFVFSLCIYLLLQMCVCGSGDVVLLRFVLMSPSVQMSLSEKGNSCLCMKGNHFVIMDPSHGHPGSVG